MASTRDLAAVWTEAKQKEVKWITRIGILSAAVHLLVLAFGGSNFSSDHKPLVREWVMQSELVLEGSQGAAASLPKAQQTGPIAVPSNLLPQLPKRFRVEKKTVADSVGEKRLEAPEAKSDKDRDGGATSQPDDDSVQKIQEKDAHLRQAIEALKKVQKEKSNKYQAPEQTKAALSRLENEIGKGGADSAGINGVADKRNRWIGKVEKIVRKNYVLPSTFRAQKKDMFVMLAVKINERGQVLELSIEQSSDDSMLDAYILSTVKNSAPYPKPPKSMVGVLFNFRFNL